MTNDLISVRVVSVRYEAEDINLYELADPDGGELPPFTAGAHIDLHFRDGRIRQYSLCNDPAERHRYVIGILKDLAGRGGSTTIFEKVHAGSILTISKPRNLFPLAAAAQRHLLLAGGIGVTPMIAMLAQLERDNADFVLHYCTRSPPKTAFRNRLAPPAAACRVHYHHDGGDPRRGLDIAALLRDRPGGTHLYYCGPPGFMTAVKNASAHWPKEMVHFEYFTPVAPADVIGSTSVDPTTAALRTTSNAAVDIPVGFQIRIQSSGALYDVPNDKSIVQVLREHGMEVETSCESGLCGTCRTRYIEGDPEHHDYVLDDEEKYEYVMICCARSKSPLLVLDL
jgi:tert-butyl alcohol monooxygenase/tert-amyl alcohol desaturase reductase